MVHDDDTGTTRFKASITMEETYNNFDLNDSPPSFTSMEETHNNFDLNDSPPSFTAGDEHESQNRTEDVESASNGEIQHISGPRENENGDEHTEPLLRDEVLGKVFECTRQAHEFYAAYARSIGFSIRKGIVRRNNKGDIIGRKWVCSKEGFRAKKYLDNRDRKREPRSITRTGCKAHFFVSLDRQSNRWVCTAFTDTHNHDLALVNHTMFLRSKRKVQDVELGAAISLHRVGVRPSQIHDYLVDVSGGYDQVGFMRGDLQNRLDRIRKCSYFNSDAETCLSYLQAKLELEPGSFFKHTLDSHNRLADLYWCDGGSRADYLCFGDVIAFDSTYRTNAYNKPLVLIIGLNHHRKTNVYGFSLLSDETQYTYTWLLTTFLEAMDGKCPQTVITDEDRAMRNAIQTVFPHAIHRLCSWHLARNAQTNVGDENFTRDFNEFMYSHMTEHDFDVRWVDLINKYGLHNHDWVSNV